MHHDERIPPVPPAETLDLLDLLTRLVDSDVGRDTLWKLSKGQGTATEDGKAWLAAEATVTRLQGSLRERLQKAVPAYGVNHTNDKK
jgi:hypothetical protein